MQFKQNSKRILEETWLKFICKSKLAGTDKDILKNNMTDDYPYSISKYCINI